MGRRLLRLAIRGACLLSLLACTGTCWAWWRSHHVGREYRGLTLAGRRFTLRSDAGRIVLLAPPRASAAAADARAAAAARAMDNDNVYWRAFVSLPDCAVNQGIVVHDPTEVVATLKAQGASAAVPPLLAALDDPARFAAAHVALMELTAAPRWPPDPTAHRRGDQVVLTYGALELGANPPDLPNRTVFLRMRTGPVPDRAQMPALRDHWHDRLGVEIASAAHAWVACAAALPPLAWCLLRLRGAAARRGRVRRGGCAVCGYALTGNVSGVCPECGTAVKACGTERRLVH